MTLKSFCFPLLILILPGCSKKGIDTPVPPVVQASFAFSSLKINEISNNFNCFNINTNPIIKFGFNARLNQSSVAKNVSFKDNSGGAVAYITSFENNDSTLVIRPASLLNYISHYQVDISTALKSVAGGALQSSINAKMTTAIDSTDKFPQLTDEMLLTLVQNQTFRYFHEFSHPASGMARERNTSGDIVTTGGTGFGVMSIIVGIERNFISKAEGLSQITKIVSFLTNNCTHYHGAFAHWINGATGVTVPFSLKDNGADLVETSFLMQGLLCARQYFAGSDAAETKLRADINGLWHGVEWSWFRQAGNQEVLYWHWSPNYVWEINMRVSGWNEALITYVLAASSPGFSIPKSVYDSGWTNNGAIKNGQSFFGVTLPLGPAFGGPLFFAHYSFLGINPTDLTDANANYMTQNIAHSKINYNYCINNPSNYNGYSKQCWGLTASDIQGGYTASSPTNDQGFIAPTAAISSMPFTPAESMAALRFFYYKLGDKIWREYGFVDAFNLNNIWFADSYLAIDQGPQIVMIENYRTGLLWRLFMSCSEIKTGMKSLGFQSPNL